MRSKAAAAAAAAAAVIFQISRRSLIKDAPLIDW
jgi:hypothetical protein